MLKTLDSTKLSFALFFSSISVSLLAFSLPFLIYDHTESALLTAFEVTCSAIGSLFSAYYAKNLSFMRSDRLNIILNEFIIVGLLVLTFFLSSTTVFIVFIYLISFCESFLSTARSGYFESIIGHISKLETDTNRQTLIGKTKSFQNFGLIIGFSIAAPILAYISFKFIFIIALLLNMISTIFIYLMKTEGAIDKLRVVRKSSFSLLFSKKLKLLSISHGINAIALFIYNGTIVFFLRSTFGLTQYMLSMYFIVTMLSALVGSILVTKLTSKRKIPKSIVLWLRIGYSLLFLLASISFSYELYILSTSLLCLFHAFCIPIWQNLFQERADESSWRIVGTSRKAMVSTCGILGSFLGGALAENFGLSVTYCTAALLSLISFFILYAFMISTRVSKGETA